jgi:uncharacterized protein YcaQ
MGATPFISAVAARRLFLAAQGLLGEPERGGGDGLAALRQVIEGLGFVQLDSINTVARAHDLILWSRLPDYRPEQLAQLLYKERFLFEHWTHDASAIPTAFYCHWKHRFASDAARLRDHPWWRHHLGADGERVVEHVRERITREGPLGSADFEHPGKRGAFWGWKPQKAALDYLWRSGELAVRDRVHFHKLYDLAEHVLPAAHRLPASALRAHKKWACESAAERLVIFTPRELGQFWGGLQLADARAFCAAAVKRGTVCPVQVEPATGGTPESAFALADWPERLRRLPEPADISEQAALRLLAPFDPVIRDRARCLRRFGFDYRFEAFTPAPRRIYGYYVLPILQGDRLIGRLSPKLERSRGVLSITGVFWEPGVKSLRSRRRLLQAAVARLAAFVGASRVEGL